MEQLSNESQASLGKAAEKAFEFAEKIIANPLIEFNGILTDKIKYWRFKNQIDTLIKARTFLKQKGLLLEKKIPIKDLTTLLEHASFEDNEEMQDCWASLLANALDPNNEFDICSIFSGILSQVSPHEILLLDHIFLKSFLHSDRHRPFIEKDNLIQRSFTSYNVTLLIFDNLIRLRLIEEEIIYPSKTQHSDDNQSTNRLIKNSTPFDYELDSVKNRRIRISEFGAEFVRKTKFR